MDEKLAKYILLICKGRYDKENYKDMLEAFNGYYHKNYGCYDITMDHRFAVELFIKPTIEYFLTPDRIYSFVNNGLFSESINEKLFFNPCVCTEFYETLYIRLIGWLSMLDVRRMDYETHIYQEIIDLSDYPLDDESWRGVI